MQHSIKMQLKFHSCFGNRDLEEKKKRESNAVQVNIMYIDGQLPVVRQV